MSAPKSTEDQTRNLRISAIEDHGDIRWAKFTEDHLIIAQEFEIMRSNEGYEDDVNTVFTVVGDSLTLKGSRCQ